MCLLSALCDVVDTLSHPPQQIGWEGTSTSITGFGMTGYTASDSVRVWINTGSAATITGVFSTTGVTLSAALPSSLFYVQGMYRNTCMSLSFGWVGSVLSCVR